MSAPPIRQRLAPGQQITCHRHEEAYVSLVLEGGYEEAGDQGRQLLGPGDVAMHGLYTCHRNGVARAGAVILNLPARGVSGYFGRVADADAVVRAAERDPVAAAMALNRSVIRLQAQALDWPDELAAALTADPQISLADWAQARGLAAETISRGFRRAFGVVPKRFRHEVKMRRALAGAIETAAPLAQVALDAGFSDQAQMSRAVSAVTGAAPGAWRKASSGDKTGR